MLYLTTHTIPDTWFRACTHCIDAGHTYTVERGSYIGQERTQLARLAVIIKHPEMRPLGQPPVSDDESIQRYFEDYIINVFPHGEHEQEQYTYGERIEPCLLKIAEMLLHTPHNNQMSISVAKPEDVLLEHPPCLRELTWNLIRPVDPHDPDDPGVLQLTSYWRSWDLHAGLPTNLGGLQLLNEMMAEWGGVKAGPQVCYSSGAHIYDHGIKLFNTTTEVRPWKPDLT